MARSGNDYNVDWLVLRDSKVQIVVHRDWFTNFTPFETYCSSVDDHDFRLKVCGIGTVVLNTRLHKTDRFYRSNSSTGTLTLYNVLYAPDFVCNVIGEDTLRHYEIPKPTARGDDKLIILAAGDSGKSAGII